MRTRFNSEGTNTMKEIKRQNFSGERALFATDGAVISECIFADGESPLKESRNIELYCDLFRWKYPLWYSRRIAVEGCTFFDGAFLLLLVSRISSRRDPPVGGVKQYNISCGI